MSENGKPNQPIASNTVIEINKWNLSVGDQGWDDDGKIVRMINVTSIDGAITVLVPGIGVDAAAYICRELGKPGPPPPTGPGGIEVPGIILPS